MVEGGGGGGGGILVTWPVHGCFCMGPKESVRGMRECVKSIRVGSVSGMREEC